MRLTWLLIKVSPPFITRGRDSVTKGGATEAARESGCFACINRLNAPTVRVHHRSLQMTSPPFIVPYPCFVHCAVARNKSALTV